MFTAVVGLSVFALAYLLFIVLPHHRWLVGLVAVGVLFVTLTVGPTQALHMVNWNVMGVFVGTVILADLFLLSNMPACLAEHVLRHFPGTVGAMLAVCALSGFLSTAMENVATVLIIAPIAAALAHKLKTSPVPLMIGVAVASNLQGAATLIGDPPSMLLAANQKMSFIDFFWFHGKPSIFFAVQIAAVAGLVVLYFFFRKHKQHSHVETHEKWTSIEPTVLMCILIVGLSLSSFIDPGFTWFSGVFSMVCGLLGFIWYIKRSYSLREFVGRFDWQTVVFLACVFVLVGVLEETGWLNSLAGFLSNYCCTTPFTAFLILVSFSVFVSAFVDNVPYLAAMLPVANKLTESMGLANPYPLLFGLLIGASVGGNITPIGASANIVTIGWLKQRGHHVSFWQFVRIGLPYTLAAVVTSCAFVWLVWSVWA